MEDPLSSPSYIVDSSNYYLVIIHIVVIVLLLVLSAIFSAFETSFSALNQFKVKVDADEGNRKAKKVLSLHEKFDNTLIMVLIGHNLSNVILSTIGTILTLIIFETVFNETIITIISTASVTLLAYIFGDMVPKIIGRSNPTKVSYNLIDISYFFYYLFFPLIIVFSLLSKLVNKIFKTHEIPSITEEDFTNIVEQLEEDDVIEENESDIITASLDFNDTEVYEILTKRNKMFVVDIKKLTKKELNDIVIRTPYSRIPVIYGSINKVIGILHVKSYIKAVLNNPNVSILSTLQKPYFVTTKVKVDDLLDGFKSHHTHIAIVKKGDVTIGMVTMEDILEELVGKISEENKVTK